jgi:hypothetical protein
LKRITISKDGDFFYVAIDGQNVGQYSQGKWESLADDWDGRNDVLVYTGPTVTEKEKTEKLAVIANGLIELSESIEGIGQNLDGVARGLKAKQAALKALAAHAGKE